MGLFAISSASVRDPGCQGGRPALWLSHDLLPDSQPYSSYSERLLSKDIASRMAHVVRLGMKSLGQMSLTRIGSELLLVPPEESLAYVSEIASLAHGISAPSKGVVSNASRMTSKPGQSELGNGLVDKMLATQT